jgi:polysaccharide export outer membrane protein
MKMTATGIRQGLQTAFPAAEAGIINAGMTANRSRSAATLALQSACMAMASSVGSATRLGMMRHAGALLLALALSCSNTPAAADYRLQAGDTLEISVTTFPEVKQRVPIQLDGTISYPLIGRMPVAGLSAAELQAKLQAALAAKVFRRRTPDGRESSVVIDPDEVTATVIEYRPIYVNGDVAKPGQQVYRPLMTVRQAIALAGGYDVMQLRINDPIMETANLVGEYQSLWIQYASEQAHVWRLKQEIGEEPPVSRAKLLDVPIARSKALEIVNVEAERLKARKVDEQAERTFLQHAVAQADEQIDVLSKQLKTEEQATQADLEEFQQTTELFKRGTLTNLRVSDARRAMLLSSTRALQTTAQLMRTKQQRADLVRQAERLAGERRSNILRELQDAIVSLSKTRFKLQSTGEKLQYTALAKSRLTRGFGNKPSITIVRNGAKGVEHLAANEEFELQPGDVVEVMSVLGDPPVRHDAWLLPGKSSETGKYTRQQTQAPP